MSSDAPKILVPAMHPEMWSNPATIENVKKLRERGFLVIEPDEGRMTGSDTGVGRYPEVGKLITEISKFLELNSDLAGKRVLVTAGGTRENIDPVRYIGNKSSGKQGVAIAEAAQARGAAVTLIGANLNLKIPGGITFVAVSTTAELQSALSETFPSCDILLMAAAIADAKPVAVSDKKIKKDEFNRIDLEKNVDLLAGLKDKKRKDQVIVGFSAETGDRDQSEANRKLIAKGLDFIYSNDVSDGKIFGADETEGWLMSNEGHKEEISLISKTTLAHLLLDRAKDKLG
jgi:phosphopantothenoylcysteine decarboxylase/phosphopantothenate--cysteine ligase